MEYIWFCGLDYKLDIIHIVISNGFMAELSRDWAVHEIHDKVLLALLKHTFVSVPPVPRQVDLLVEHVAAAESSDNDEQSQTP